MKMRTRKPAAGILVRSITSLVLLIALYLPGVPALEAQQPVPVVFVHGLLGSGSSLSVLSNYVDAQFNVTVISPTLGWSAPYETQSANLQDALAGQTGAVAISHSNGSIVTRRYLVDNGSLNSRINRHLTIGGLHRGALLAKNVRNLKVLEWITEVLALTWDPFNYYFFNDPAFASHPKLAAFRIEVAGFLDTFIDPLSTASIIKLVTQLGFDAATPVLAEMEPASTTFLDINSLPSLGVEAQVTGTAGRVSIATRTNPDLLPWSLGSSSPQTFRRATRKIAYFGLLMYYFYLQHPDPVLRANAYRWMQMYWAMEPIPVAWANMTGSLLAFSWVEQAGFYAALVDKSDGLLPWSTQDYVSGTSKLHLGSPFDILHDEQRSSLDVRDAVNDVLAENFAVPQTTPPPPPTGSTVSVAISGPTEVNDGINSTWTANAFGGTGGYTYAWFRSDGGGPMSFVGSNRTYTGPGFGECQGTTQLRIEVTAGSGGVAAQEMTVTTVGCAPNPFE